MKLSDNGGRLDLPSKNGWFDVMGMLHVSRAYNLVRFDEESGMVVKSGSNPKLRDEADFYTLVHSEDVPSGIRVMFPRLFWTQGGGSGDLEMRLEYYGYPNLGELLVGGYLDRGRWDKAVLGIYDALSLWREYGNRGGRPSDALDMYAGKTDREVQAYFDHVRRENSALGEFLYHGAPDVPGFVFVNGEKFRVYAELMPELREYLDRHLLQGGWCFMHGDCCLSNILYDGTSHVLKFVDPRGRFGRTAGLFGDQRYDVAKLYHSFFGWYDFLCRDRFQVSDLGGGRFSYAVDFGNAAESAKVAREVFVQTFFRDRGDIPERDVRVVAATIFLGMSNRHYDNPDRQLVTHLIGIEMLNHALFGE